MNGSIMGKRSYSAKGIIWLSAVLIATILPWHCVTGYGKPMQFRAIIYLNNSVIDPTNQDTDATIANNENNQIPTVPEPAPLNTAIEDGRSGWHTVRMRVTAYCPCALCCGHFAVGRTANGYAIRRGDRFAAAPQKYLFGTEIIVPQYNEGKPIKVLDRGGVITGNRLDVFFNSHAQAAKWGAKYLNVKIRQVHQVN